MATKEDTNAIAQILKDNHGEALDADNGGYYDVLYYKDTLEALVKYFKHDNYSFDESAFLEKCGK